MTRAVLPELRGGHPVIDFVNTVAWRGDPARRIDYLTDYAQLVAWCRHADVVSAAEARQLNRAMRADERAAQRVLARAKRLREALYALWTAPSTQQLKAVREAYLAAMRSRELRFAGDGVTWVDPELGPRSLVDRIAVEAVILLTGPPLARVKQCHDSACGWLFLDSSHRQNRRWCSAADCGNRDRARRHYERTHG